MPKKGLVLWCQHADCGVGIDAGSYKEAGSGLIVPPSICPRCERETVWHTMRPWKLTKNDAAFCRQRGIDPET